MKKFFTAMFALAAIVGTAFTAHAEEDVYFKCFVKGQEVKDGDRIDLSKYYDPLTIGDIVFKHQYNPELTVVPTVSTEMSVTVDYTGNKTPLSEDGQYGADLTVNFCGFTGSCTAVNSGETYTRVGETKDGDVIDMQTELVVVGLGSSADGDVTKLALDVEFTMTMTIEDESVKLIFFLDQQGLAGIHDIDVDSDADAVYFDLQGRRVENPSNGLFIVKKGSKVAKQFIR